MHSILSRLRFLSRKSARTPSQSRFVDLAPTSDADPTGIYIEALTFATNNAEVLNVALTGPYGSGKSSIIKAFLLRYPGSPLLLSLASFIPDGEVRDSRVEKPEIERSILQQILYGADADKLPFSRFKRIQVPRRWSSARSLAVSAGFFFLWYLFTKQAELVSGQYFKPFDFSNWFNIVSFVAGSLAVWTLVHGIYLQSLGLSLKSVSLKDIQIAPRSEEQDSILNRHLDEIIYFFQSTDYDLVVIEDLDRFNDPDIFVTLREINALVNANANIHRRIRFLYALRDDMFVNTDRTKFFEFIVPVIPVINHSNSIDKVLEYSRRIAIDTVLDPRFLRDVSRYLTDLRLIRNIFNEFVVYSANLRAEGDSALDPNKLLAVLIYKNVIPSDFAALHRQEGTLAAVLMRYDEFIAESESRIRSEIAAIQADVNAAEKELARDIAELRRIYAMAIIEKVSPPSTYLSTDQFSVALGELPNHPELGALLSAGSVRVSSSNNYGTRVDLRGIETSVDSTMSFSERKVLIERKSSDDREAMARRSHELQSQLASLRMRKFNEVVRESAELVQEIFANAGENRELLKFLVLEGYLDDTYYQYTSLFHGGRLSPADNRFLIQIRGFTTPEPDFQLHNTAEVIASMREEDFSRSYVLNRFIVDTLLATPGEHRREVEAAVGFMADHVDNCEDFFLSYYARGAQVQRLVPALATNQPSFIEAALKSRSGIQHAARILAYSPAETMVADRPGGRALGQFVSRELSRILDEPVDFDISRLAPLVVQVADLSSIVDHDQVVTHLAETGLYRMSVGNIRQVMARVVGFPELDDLETRHFSALREAGYRPLLDRIDTDFEQYLQDILLSLPDNTGEDVDAIIEVLNHGEVASELRSRFLDLQTVTFPALDDVPSDFRSRSMEQVKIAATWENCLSYMGDEAYDEEILTGYLQDQGVSATLSRQPVPEGEGAARLRQFLIGNDGLPDDIYRSYARRLPRSFKALPDVGPSKARILVEERRIEFDAANYMDIDDETLKALFIELNFDDYRARRDEFVVGLEVQEILLGSNLADTQKMIVVGDIPQGDVAANPSLAAAVGPVLDRVRLAPEHYSAEFISAIILNARSEALQLSLLNKMHGALTNSEVLHILQALRSPYRDIATYGRYPMLDDTPANRELATWLDRRRVVSSVGHGVFGGIRINTFRREPSLDA